MHVSPSCLLVLRSWHIIHGSLAHNEKSRITRAAKTRACYSVAEPRYWADAERSWIPAATYGNYQGTFTLYSIGCIADACRASWWCGNIGQAHPGGGSWYGNSTRVPICWGLGQRCSRLSPWAVVRGRKRKKIRRSPTLGKTWITGWAIQSRTAYVLLHKSCAWAKLYTAFTTIIRSFDLAIDDNTSGYMEWCECTAAYYPRRHLHAWCHPALS